MLLLLASYVHVSILLLLAMIYNFIVLQPNKSDATYGTEYSVTIPVTSRRVSFEKYVRVT